MQTRPRRRSAVTASLLCAAVLVVGGCQAQAPRSERTQSSAVAPQSNSVPLPAAPGADGFVEVVAPLAEELAGSDQGTRSDRPSHVPCSDNGRNR